MVAIIDKAIRIQIQFTDSLTQTPSPTAEIEEQRNDEKRASRYQEPACVAIEREPETDSSEVIFIRKRCSPR